MAELVAQPRTACSWTGTCGNRASTSAQTPHLITGQSRTSISSLAPALAAQRHIVHSFVISVNTGWMRSDICSIRADDRNARGVCKFFRHASSILCEIVYTTGPAHIQSITDNFCIPLHCIKGWPKTQSPHSYCHTGKRLPFLKCA